MDSLFTEIKSLNTVKVEDKNPRLYAKRCEEALKKRDKTQALVEIDKAIAYSKKDDDRESYTRQKFKILEAFGEYHDPRLYLKRCKEALRKGNKTQALVEIDKAIAYSIKYSIKEDEKDDYIKEKLEILESFGEYSKCVELIKFNLRCFTSYFNISIIRNMSKKMNKKGQYKICLELLEIIRRNNKYEYAGDWELIKLEAITKYKLARYRDAIICFKKCIESNESEEECLGYILKCYQNVNDMQHLTEYLESLLDKYRNTINQNNRMNQRNVEKELILDTILIKLSNIMYKYNKDNERSMEYLKESLKFTRTSEKYLEIGFLYDEIASKEGFISNSIKAMKYYKKANKIDSTKFPKKNNKRDLVYKCYKFINISIVAIFIALSVSIVINNEHIPKIIYNIKSQLNNKEQRYNDKKSIKGESTDKYIMYDSSSRYLNESELEKYSQEQLGLIRNEIFARRGYIFGVEPYKSYFESKDWYKPDSNFKGDYSELNDYEIANINLIKNLENQSKA